MTEPAIDIQSLSKCYRLGEGGAAGAQRTLREALSGMWRRRDKQSHETQKQALWALRDINLKIHPGEVVGIIGRNGAGKSTLLKILSRITEPTSGRVELRGRVASLLEVGTGFHPELTGRENVYLNGSILGMSRREIRDKFFDIVEFSGVGEFLGTPVKRYSSGMRVRLAFAVAAHLDPEILVIDEVLSVGDAEFQNRCLGKMQELAGSQGRTVLFVSHNMGAVRSLCRRAVLLDAGRVVNDADSQSVVSQYFETQNAEARDGGHILWPAPDAPGDDTIRLDSVMLSNAEGDVRSAFSPQDTIDITMRYRVIRPLTQVRGVVQLRSLLGEVAFTSTDHEARSPAFTQPGEYISRCRIPGGLLNVGEYALRVWADVPGVRRVADSRDCLKLSVTGIGNHGSAYIETAMPGIVSPKLDWSVQRATMPLAA